MYVRPLLEYNSSPSPKYKVSVRAAWKCSPTVYKVHSGLYNLTCYQRLICLGPESIELRRLRSDLLLVYKIVFGLTGFRREDFFCINVCRNVFNLRGHPYQLIHNVAKTSVRNTFFVNRLVGIWNNLHLNACAFNSFKQFKQSLA
jgi:hypothetical protein